MSAAFLFLGLVAQAEEGFFPLNQNLPIAARDVERGTVMLAALTSRSVDAQGTAFLVDERTVDGNTFGLYLTNRHVIEAMGRHTGVQVLYHYAILFDFKLVPPRDRSGWQSSIRAIVAKSKDEDLAAFIVEFPRGADHKPVRLRDWEARDDRQVVCLGHPELDSRVDWNVEHENRTRQTFWSRGLVMGMFLKDNHRVLRHTADLLKGSSGGPVIDSSGNVIGMNTKRTSSEDDVGTTYKERVTLGEAIPAEAILKFLEKVRPIWSSLRL